MRRVAAKDHGLVDRQVHRVVSFEGLSADWAPDLRLLVLVSDGEQRGCVQRMAANGLPNVRPIQAAALEPGDVVVPLKDNELLVLFRESDQHHALLMTNRCNSLCLMCSQPPTRHADSWMVNEAIEVVRHIRKPPEVLGLTGGEPLLLRAGLRRVLDAIARHLPGTRVEVLTNGRLFSVEGVVRAVLGTAPGSEPASDSAAQPVSWLVPLYAHANFLHDFVVQAPGAFDQTVAGLLQLQAYRQPIQLRVLLIEPVLQILDELCEFIGRNLPFVREVALMACEPIGFALANREHCEVDLADWAPTLLASAGVLRRHGVPFVVMNTPLCALPRSLWPHARRSISDWKNNYADTCTGCAVRESCTGLFEWAETGWKPTQIRAIQPNEIGAMAFGVRAREAIL